MPRRISFSTTVPGADRIHHVNAAHVAVVLSRLPEELWSRLRSVHFNDKSQGARLLGYVNRSRREIALCALPPRMSLTRALRGHTPEQFGAKRGAKWPSLAIRRFMLYNVFLHELGHLQLVHKDANSARRQFAHEKLAQSFALTWSKRLLSEPFVHPDPVHNAPSPAELATIDSEIESLTISHP